MELEKIRIIPDFPIKGVDFMDITTLLDDAETFQKTFQELLEQARELNPEVVVPFACWNVLMRCWHCYHIPKN